MTQGQSFRLHEKPDLNEAALIVGWTEDASKIGIRCMDFLIGKLGCREFGEIMPEGFFPMSGVVVEDDVAQFPESKFYVSDRHNLVLLRSNSPRADWGRFINAVLDVAQRDCGVREIYTIGAMVSYAAHTMPRPLVSIVNLPQMKERVSPFGVVSDSDYETPQGQKPTLSSYLLWIARQREIQGANLWVPVPYYFAPLEDPRACKRLADFFNIRFSLGLDLADLDREVATQNRRIGELYSRSAEIEGYVRKLETGEALDSDESEKLAQAMAEFLRSKI
jgi:predicted ATP-grasp superfamily ATP-dependent carboligase